MDPQKLSQLDPKLREAYQRVMGTVIPEPQTKPDLPQAQTSPQPDAPAMPMPDSTPSLQPQQPAQPQPKTTFAPAPQPEPFFKPQPAPDLNPQSAPNPEAAIPQQPSAQNSNFVQMNSEVSAAASASTPNFTAPAAFDAASIKAPVAIKKKKNMLMSGMIGIIILVFIAVYGLFWIRIFNLNLPFLP